MIVLGPHVLSRPPERGNNPYHHHHDHDDEDVDQQNVEEEEGDEFDDGEEAAAGRLDESDDDDDDDDDDRILTDARSDVSRSLGSIGAPPLTPPSRLHRRRRRRRCPRRHRRLHRHRATTDMAMSHVDLLRTMRVVLWTLRAGTSVRLGLGPVVPPPFAVAVVVGGGRATGNDNLPVARAESAREARRSRLLPRPTGRRRRHRGGIGMESRPASGDDDDDDDGDEDNDELPATTLTFQKLRDVLYRAIVDQAASLRDALESYGDVATSQTTTTMTTTTNMATTMAEWETFALDLRHSVSPGRTTRPPPLTLSRLSDWIDRLGGYLSFVLSVFLDDYAALPTPGATTSSASSDRIDRDSHRLRGDDLEDRIVAGIARSSQFARERAAYLRSACPSSRPPREDEIKVVAAAVDDGDDNDNDDDRRGIENAIIETNNIATREGRRRNGQAYEDALLKLHSAFEAARVSLWAFGCHREIDGRPRCRSYDAADNDSGGAGGGEGEIEDARVWWSHFKEFVERTRASIPDVEGHFLLGDGCHPREKETPDDVGSGVPPRNDVPIVAETSEHVCHAVDGNGDGESCLLPRGGGDESKYAGKTLVFSGSGVGTTRGRGVRTTRQSHAARAGPASGRPPPSAPRAYDVADHSMLLRDLERRIRTMGLPRVHEVVADTDLGADVGGCINDASDAMPDRSTGRRRNDPFFLGASGSLLAELTSVINGTPSPEGREEDVCSSADNFPSPSAYQ
ncbi:hypothetical protein ACHAW5_003684 [Stephanodiscus triporus]|uniref:Uncharacterized protein n=1 Tax=Stephanodiscus triporus TaxID=2934178 RepID=A0ABD3QKP1_9STRA